MQAEVLTDQHSELVRVAEPFALSWLASGATGVRVLVDGVERGAWPTSPPISAPGVRATISQGKRKFAEIEVSGMTGPAELRRLETEANAISRLWRLEDELQLMTVELADCQDRLVAVCDLTHAIRGQVHADEVLRILVDQANDLAGSNAAFIAVRRGDALQVVTSPAEFEEDRTETVTELLLLMQERPRPLLLDKGTAAAFSIMFPPGVHSAAAVPVVIEGKSEAVLGVFYGTSRPITAGTRRLLEVIADQAGTLIENALANEREIVQVRLRRDLELAAVVQRGLITNRLPDVPGIDLAARYRPAAEIGGDLYHMFRREDGKLAFAVADATGKGIPAALVMAMFRSSLVSAAATSNEPSEAMNRLNRELEEDLTELGMFITAFVGFFDPECNEIAYANCGHSPVLYCEHGGAATMLEADAPPLGVLSGDISTTSYIRLNPGDHLVIATDGFSEAIGKGGEMFGYDRLLSDVEFTSGRSAALVADVIMASVAAFTRDVPQADDQAIVVLNGVPK